MSAPDPHQPARPDRRRRTAAKWIRPLVWLGAIAGVLVLAGLAVEAGAAKVIAALAIGGPALFLLVILHPLQLLPQSEAWRLVFPPGSALERWPAAYATWLGQAVNLLLPVATLGGEVVKARLAALRGVDGTAAAASVIADKTGQAAGVLVVMIVALGLMARSAADTPLLAGAATAAVLLAAGLIGFIMVQRAGGPVRWLERQSAGSGMFARMFARMTARMIAGPGPLTRAGAGARRLHEHLHGIYRRPWRFIFAVGLRVLATLLMTLEVWWAADMLGMPISLETALALRVTGFAARSAAFFVWGGLGVQEAAFAALGLLYGLPVASLVALSLATRVRETAVALVGLPVWLGVEAKRAMVAGSRAIQPPPSTRSPS